MSKDIWVTIEGDNAGEPDGTPVTNGTSAVIDASIINVAPLWKRFTFPGDVSLSAATKYWIVLHGDYDKNDADYIAWRSDNSSAAFADGNVAFHADGGAWSAEADDDFMFRVIESTAGTGYHLNTSGNIEINSGELSAIYYTNKKDIGYIAEVKIIIDYIATVGEGLAWDSDPASAFDDSQTKRFTGENAPSALTFEIRTSEDDITWSDWGDWISADYYCRYYQIRMTITRESLDTSIIVSNFTINADLPDIDDKGTDTISVAETGVSITFEKTYHENPVVAIDILTGEAVYPVITSLSITGFTLFIYDIAGQVRTGTISWKSHGI